MLLTELKVLIIVDGLTMKVASNHNSLVVHYTIHKMNRPCTKELKEVGNIRNSLEEAQEESIESCRRKKTLNIGLCCGTALRICQF